MASSQPFRDQVAIVTGGATGLGAALCEALAAEGAKVIVLDRDGAGAAKVAAKIQAEGGAAEPLVVDVRDATALQSAIETVAERHRRLYYLFNNAGLGCWGDALEFTPETWREILEVNYWGCVHGTLEAYRWMKEHGGGRIVNIASLAGLISVPGAAPYSAAKHAVVGFSLALRAEAAEFGVQVSVVCPGPIKSQFHSSMLRAAGETPGRAAPADTLDPALAAREILRGVAGNEAIIVFPARARRTWWKWRLSPQWLAKAQRRIVENLRRRES